MSDMVTDADIASDWPERWARVANGPSKPRTNLRRQYRQHVERQKLLSEGKCCGTCRWFQPHAA